MKSYRVRNDFQYKRYEDTNPAEGDLWVDESDDYIKIDCWMEEQWCCVTGISQHDEDTVKIEYNADDRESEDTELLDYQYRIGAL